MGILFKFSVRDAGVVLSQSGVVDGVGLCCVVLCCINFLSRIIQSVQFYILHFFNDTTYM